MTLIACIDARLHVLAAGSKHKHEISPFLIGVMDACFSKAKISADNKMRSYFHGFCTASNIAFSIAFPSLLGVGRINKTRLNREPGDCPSESIYPDSTDFSIARVISDGKWSSK